MKLQFYMGHPAHFHLMKNSIIHLQEKGHTVSVLIKKKDVLENLLIEASIPYVNILSEGRKDSKLGMFWGMIKRDYRAFCFSKKFKPNLLIGTSVENSHLTKLMGIPSINLNEDDSDVVPLYAKFSYSWASEILNPISCDSGRWNAKAIKYNGYHELAYLHPNHFTPSKTIVEKYFSVKVPFFILRFAKLKAHHDAGIKGIDEKTTKKLIEKLLPYGKVYITSERNLPKELEKYRMQINPLDIHHVLAFSTLYIGDSQTMAAEAGVLGTPFIRFNDFVGRIGYLDELENKYELGYGIKPSQVKKLFSKVDELLEMKDRVSIFQARRKKMLSDKIDYAQFLTWFIEEYPNSAKIMRENPNYQYKFK